VGELLDGITRGGLGFGTTTGTVRGTASAAEAVGDDTGRGSSPFAFAAASPQLPSGLFRTDPEEDPWTGSDPFAAASPRVGCWWGGAGVCPLGEPWAGPLAIAPSAFSTALAARGPSPRIMCWIRRRISCRSVFPPFGWSEGVRGMTTVRGADGFVPLVLLVSEAVVRGVNALRRTRACGRPRETPGLPRKFIAMALSYWTAHARLRSREPSEQYPRQCMPRPSRASHTACCRGWPAGGSIGAPSGRAWSAAGGADLSPPGTGA